MKHNLSSSLELCFHFVYDNQMLSMKCANGAAEFSNYHYKAFQCGSALSLFFHINELIFDASLFKKTLCFFSIIALFGVPVKKSRHRGSLIYIPVCIWYNFSI